MGRKKLRPQRSKFEPTSERTFYERLLNSEYNNVDRIDLYNLIRGGEDTYLELKVRLTNNDKIAAEIVALANSGGGAIIFGVNDNRLIEGVDDAEQVEEDLRFICRTQIVPPVYPYIDKVAFDNGRRIVVLEIDEKRAPHYAFDNRYFIREGSTKREATGEEVVAMFARLRPTGFESVPLYGATVNDLDESFIWSYIRELQGELFKSKGSYPTDLVVREMQLGLDYADQVVPTVCGLLLFGQSARCQEIFPRNRIQLVRISGDTSQQPVIEKSEFSGNVATIFERAISFIGRYADLWDTPTLRARAADREPIEGRANYQRAVITEALTNALVHRDYCIREQPIRLTIYDKRIEISNPCVAGLMRKGIELYGVVNVPNPRLKAIFKSPAYGLKTVTGGIPQLRRSCLKFAGREPKISILPEEFKIEIPGG